MGFGEFLELFILALGLSMDAFAVSICKGLAMKKAGLREGMICGGWFGGFQGLMPLIGWLLAGLIGSVIRSVDYWIAFGLLCFLGFNMLKDAFSKDECDCEGCNCDLSVKAMFVMAVATSIDALAVGVQLYAQDANIWVAISLIGVITFLVCTAGVKIGNVFGSRYEKKAQMAGGIILMGLGLKFLIEGLIENFL